MPRGEDSRSTPSMTAWTGRRSIWKPLRSGASPLLFLACEGLRNPRPYVCFFASEPFFGSGFFSGGFPGDTHILRQLPCLFPIDFRRSRRNSDDPFRCFVRNFSPEISRIPSNLSRDFRSCMASALLASRNEPHWGERKIYDHPSSQNHGRQAVTPSISNDSSSHNRKPTGLNNRRESTNNGYVTYSISSYSKKELKDLKKRLISELEQVRALSNRIDSRELQTRSGYSASHFSGGYGGREVTSANRPLPLLLNASSDSPVSEGLKDKRTPKANQHFRPSEFLIGKEKMPPPQESKKVSGFKRPLPFVSDRDPKRPASDAATGKLLSTMMKRCGQILGKLMKHKFGYIFNVPVDAVKMGLHDYHQIIKNPMDLGTVKTKLGDKLYATPLDFAEDIRLTFNNALVYNPKGHEVYVLAEQLLAQFEELFVPAYSKYENEKRRIVATPPPEIRRSAICLDEERPRLHSRVLTADRAKTPDRFPPTQSYKSLPPPSKPLPPPPPPPTTMAQFQAPVFPASKQLTGRPATGKLPKPKAKDPNKREMSFEEKEKLSAGLQNLPQEKMDQVVQIMRRRNAELSQDGDEIELDIEVVDKETLWELDRFVCNVKKMMNKMKRQAVPVNPNFTALEGNKSPVASEPPEVAAAKSKKGENVGAEEDVDIGEDIPTSSFPPVEIEKDAAGYGSSKSSSSSSSSSGSSSSSDSDSGSSSGSDSDADEAQSPFIEAKTSPRSQEKREGYD
ncbi:Bromodomain [Macleaya cordata]|uniref:Bromodomain n=1 Tax=Macleaya cordata TaxID=56857 RepID=A0A200QXP7_MACCD|nr:Bromodomain [Macleaya cordata]